MSPSSRQRAFSRDATAASQTVYDALEAKAALPTVSVARFSASCVRRGRPAAGLNVGLLYLCRTHTVFCAHFVTAAAPDMRVQIPLRRVLQARRAWYGRLLPYAVLVRCKALPDYLFILASKDEQRDVVSLLSNLIAQAKEDDQSDDASSHAASDLDQEDPLIPESEPEPDTEPEAARVEMKTLKRVKFSSHLQQVTQLQAPITAHTAIQQAGMDEENLIREALDDAVARSHQTAHRESRHDSLIFFTSSFILLFITVGICVALYLLQLRMSVITSRLAMQH